MLASAFRRVLVAGIKLCLDRPRERWPQRQRRAGDGPCASRCADLASTKCSTCNLSGSGTSSGSYDFACVETNIRPNSCPSRMLAKAVLKIVEPTLRIAIAFLHLILFQLAVAEAQEKDRRAGDRRPQGCVPRLRRLSRNGGGAGRRIHDGIAAERAGPQPGRRPATQGDLRAAFCGRQI